MASAADPLVSIFHGYHDLLRKRPAVRPEGHAGAGSCTDQEEYQVVAPPHETPAMFRRTLVARLGSCTNRLLLAARPRVPRTRCKTPPRQANQAQAALCSFPNLVVPAAPRRWPLRMTVVMAARSGSFRPGSAL